MILLSACATVIASQALISGAYSLTQQAVQLGFSPRITVVHTHEEHSGQIYIPEVNWALMIACVVLVAQFRSSDKLAAAYGLAVTGTMTVTSIAFFVVLTRTWRWAWYKAVPLCLLFLTVDVTFLVSNARKFLDGGWVPFTIGLAVFTLFTTWITGRRRLSAQMGEYFLPLEAFLEDVHSLNPPRVQGTAVFLTANPNGVPVLLLHHFKHNQVLHEKVVLLTITSEQTPYVKASHRMRVEQVDESFYRLVARFGFMETPNVPQLLAASRDWGLAVDLERTTYYLGRETLIASKRPGMARWRKRLFAFVSRNARSATDYFGIPPNRVVELGMQVEL
jgi:KUP system potassium uptake protein